MCVPQKFDAAAAAAAASAFLGASQNGRNECNFKHVLTAAPASSAALCFMDRDRKERSEESAESYEYNNRNREREWERRERVDQEILFIRKIV